MCLPFFTEWRKSVSAALSLPIPKGGSAASNRLVWRNNPSPFGTVPIFKQGLAVRLSQNSCPSRWRARGSHTHSSQSGKRTLKCCRPLLLVVTGMMILKAGTTYLDSAPVHAHNVPALLNAYAHVLNHCRPAAAWDCKAPFGSNTNRASDKYSFLMSLSLDRCTTFCAVLHILFAV